MWLSLATKWLEIATKVVMNGKVVMNDKTFAVVCLNTHIANKAIDGRRTLNLLRGKTLMVE